MALMIFFSLMCISSSVDACEYFDSELSCCHQRTYTVLLVYSNTTWLAASGQPQISGSDVQDSARTQSEGFSDYILQGIGAQEGHDAGEKTSQKLPDMTARPLPGSGIASNASWSTFIIEASTYRPDEPIKWSSSMPKIEKCWSDIVTWRSSSVSWWNENYGNRTISGPVSTSTSIDTYNTSITATIYPSSVSAYTLCDGLPRVDANPETKATVRNLTKTYSHRMIANGSLPDWDVPQPCEPDSNMCRMWYYHSDILDVNEGELLSQCGRPTNYNESCVIRGGPIELIYWPVPPKADICEKSMTGLFGPAAFAPNTTVQPEIPETITTLGHTFTSGTVYLSFSTLYASWDGFWDHIGPDFSDLIVPLPSSSLFSQCGGQRFARNHGTPLNYADLNWPVPASAYSCQARCDPVGMPICPDCAHTEIPTTGECGTIWSDINPNLAMPTEIRDLVPEWSTCLMYNDRIPNFWFDPPIALTKKTAIAIPTAHALLTTEPAAPSSSLPTAVPVETGSSEVPEQQPTGASSAAEETNSNVSSNKEPVATSLPPSDKGGPTESIEQDGTTTIVRQPQQSVDTTLSEGANDVPTSVSSSHAPAPIASNSKPLFTYDPITSLIDVTTKNPAFSDSTSSPPLDALSVLESALSSLNGAVSSTKADEASSIAVVVGSETIMFPLPSQAPNTKHPTHLSEAQRQPESEKTSQGILLTASNSDIALSIGPSGAAVVEPSRTTSVSLPGPAISSLLSSAASAELTPSSSGPQALGTQEPSTATSPRPAESISASFRYSPLDSYPISTSTPSTTHLSVSSPANSVLQAAGSLTFTAHQAGSLPVSHAASVAGTTLSIGGEAVTLSGSHVLSLATGGIVLSITSRETSLMSTVTAHEPTSSKTEASNELPGVVQWQPESTESSSSIGSNEGDATSTADEAGVTELGSGTSSYVKRIVQETRVIALLVLFVLMILLI